MKKLLIALLGVLTLSGCFGRMTTYKTISFSTLMDMIDNKESFVLVIGSSECSHCASFKPKMEAFIKTNQIKVYYIDILKLSEEEDEILNSHIRYTGTPYTVFMENGKVKKIDGQSYSIEGDRDIEYIKKTFKKNGYLGG